MSAPSDPAPLLVGLSGASSSGKTTVARLIRDIFPGTIILHQDDFYLPEDQLPVRDGVADWDCAESLDIPAFVEALKRLKETGEIPPDFVSKEDRNDVGESGIGPDRVQHYKTEVEKTLASSNERSRTRRLCIVDGFLLFGESVKAAREAFDLRLMLRATYAKAKQRREARSGYATIEGFWEDPPGYVDKIVWPAYVQEHAFLFEHKDVEGDADEIITQQLGIHMVPGKGGLNVEQMLRWATDKILTALREG